MTIPHWLIGLVMLVAIGSFVGFAFHQGQKVKPDKNKNHDDWIRLTGGGPPPPSG